LAPSELLQQSCADAVRGRAVHHALDDQRIELAPAVVHDHVLQDAHAAGRRIDLHQTAVGGVGEDELRRYATVGVDRPGQRVLVRVARLQPRLLAGR
jgi:hypothetical protein